MRICLQFIPRGLDFNLHFNSLKGTSQHLSLYDILVFQVKSVVLHTLNRARFTVAVDSFLKTGWFYPSILLFIFHVSIKVCPLFIFHVSYLGFIIQSFSFSCQLSRIYETRDGRIKKLQTVELKLD